MQPCAPPTDYTRTWCEGAKRHRCEVDATGRALADKVTDCAQAGGCFPQDCAAQVDDVEAACADGQYKSVCTASQRAVECLPPGAVLVQDCGDRVGAVEGPFARCKA